MGKMYKVVRNTVHYLSLFIFILSISSYSKNSCLRNVNDLKSITPSVYSHEKFEVEIEQNVVYAKGLSHEKLNSSTFKVLDLKLDLYYPKNNISNRPLYFFIHGGGFKEGSKTGKYFVKLAHYYASRGWVFVSIDYRIKKDIGTTPDEWAEYTKNSDLSTKIKNLNAIYPSTRDAKAALRWVIKNAELYGIDKNYVTVGGGSAGAMIAIALGISEPQDFTNELSTEEDYTLKTTHLNTYFKVNTIVSHWGSKLPLDIFKKTYGYNRLDGNDPPIFIAHGIYDKIVDISKAKDIVNIYKNLGIPFAFYPIDKQGHGLWSAKFNGKSLEELAFNFIVKQQSLIVK